MEKVRFGQCTLLKLERQFGLRLSLSSPALTSWLQTPVTLTDLEKNRLQELQTLLTLNANSWNEQELALQLIGPILSMVQFIEFYRFKLFAGRHIEAVIDDIELGGEPDTIIATGFREPEVPFFAFTEYKREIDPEGDPAGQTLVAMMVGQKLNNDDQPIYGGYIVGENWRFMILEGKSYTISRSYASSSNDIYDVYRILKALRAMIMERTAEKGH
jgi:hypothetical protein